MARKPKINIPESYPEAYLICKDPSIGHNWIEDEMTTMTSNRRSCYVVVKACGRCTMVKIDTFSGVTGDRVGSTVYRQPTGYKLGFRALSSEVRLARWNVPKQNPDRPPRKGRRPYLPDELMEVEIDARSIL